MWGADPFDTFHLLIQLPLLAAAAPVRPKVESADPLARAVELLGGSGGVSGQPIPMITLFLLLALLPVVFLALSSFVKLSVVFGILRNALGTGQIPPTSVTTLLALVMSGYIMTPVVSSAYHTFQQTIAKGDSLESSKRRQTGLSLETTREGLLAAIQPFEEFLLRHSAWRERSFFATLHRSGTAHSSSVETQPDPCAEVQNPDETERVTCRPAGENFLSIVPAFILTELKEAFVIGFALFLPFLVVDLVVTNILMGLGMMMVSPTTISLPFKLILFVLCDGWFLLSKSLIVGYLHP